jgi:hypothetical protein
VRRGPIPVHLGVSTFRISRDMARRTGYAGDMTVAFTSRGAGSSMSTT